MLYTIGPASQRIGHNKIQSQRIGPVRFKDWTNVE